MNMKILIDNGGYAFKNNGDTAMLIVTADRFHQHYPDAEIQIFTDAPQTLKKIISYAFPVSLDGRRMWLNAWNILGGGHKLFPKVLWPWLQRNEAYLKIKIPNLSRKWVEYRLSKRGYDIHAMHEFLDIVQQADIVIGSGGGYITDSFQGHACSLLQTLSLAQSYGKPTAMFGQGLGPFQSENILFWAKKVLPKLACLSLREGEYSKPCALSSGVPVSNIKVTGDDAISLANSMTPGFIGSKIGVNLRVSNYSGIGNEALAELKLFLDGISKSLRTELCAVPISLHEGDSDYESIAKLLGPNQLMAKEAYDAPEKVIKQIGLCRIIITGSYHAGVFALSQGISVVAVAATDYYRHKFEGLSSQFGVGCYVVDRENIDYGSKLKIAVDLAWENAERDQSVLLKKAQEQMDLSKTVYYKFIVDCNHK